jgi:outer membrane protein assembly factor BamA
VDIQPELLSRETDPGARFTFGKRLSPRVRLVYSLGLNDPESTFYQAEYRFRAGAEANARVQRDDSGSYTYGVGQRLRWGAPRARARGERRRRAPLEAVDFAGPSPLTQSELREAVKSEPGDRVSSFDVQADAERLERTLQSRHYFEALVTGDLESGRASFELRPGPRYTWEVRGLDAPPPLDAELREARMEVDALEVGRRRLLEVAHERGFPAARITTRVEDLGEDARHLVFEVAPGRRFAQTRVEFPGADVLSRKQLLDAAGGLEVLMLEPERALRQLRAAYDRAHRRAVEIDAPVLRESGDTLSVSVAVREGPPARIASVGFEGATLDASVLEQKAQLEPGSELQDTAIDAALQRLRDEYLKRGYGSARVTPDLRPSGPADLGVVFKVEEGLRRVVGEIHVHGLRRTHEDVVRGRFDLRPGDPLDPRKLVQLERRLLQLDVFSRVAATAPEESPADVLVEVEERGPYSVAYDLRFSQEERASVVGDAEIGNLFGRALALGGRFRQGTRIRESRASLSLPALGRTRGFTLAGFMRADDFTVLHETGFGPTPGPLEETRHERGVELQRSLSLPNYWGLLYGYRFKRISSELSGWTQDVSSVETSLLRDTRNDPLDARVGRFWSLSLELAPKQLASDLAFFRLYGQAYISRPIGRSFTWAQGYRLGVANGLNESKLEEVRRFGTAADLFRAGGPNSLRGYATDSVGPSGPVSGLSTGGEAVAILSEELRYHHPTGLGAAVFYDGGNVFARIQDLGFDWQHSVGVGARYSSPFGLLRLDVAFPLNPRPFDRPYQWYFSIGQAF